MNKLEAIIEEIKKLEKQLVLCLYGARPIIILHKGGIRVKLLITPDNRYVHH